MEEGKEDKFFEANEFSSSTNKEVANILDKAVAKPAQEANKVKIEEADWGGDDNEIEIEDDEVVEEANTEIDKENGSDIFVPPSPGPDPLFQCLRQNPQNAALNACLGEFRKAAELLKSQLAVTKFENLK